MKKIRRSIFETNSSSSHSIHIDNGMELMDNSIVPDENGEVHIYDGEYGWDYGKLTTAMEKASYCFTDQGETEILKKLIKDQTGANKVIFHKDDGYVDHQSRGTTMDAHKSEEDLRNLIFNPRSTIYTGNDNSEAPLHFYFDSSNGRCKVSIIETKVLREMGINSIMEESSEDVYEKLNWTYSPSYGIRDIQTAVHEFIDHYNVVETYDFWDSSGKISYIDIDIENKKIISTIESKDNKEVLYTKEYKILIEENK